MRIRAIFSLMLIVAVFLPACSNVPELAVASNTPTPGSVISVQPLSTVTPISAGARSSTEFVGRVVDMNGTPVNGAHVESSENSAISDQDGWFRVSGRGLPGWLKVTAPGLIARTRAAVPGVPVLFRLSSDDGKTTVLHIAGDTMFGRRFFDLNGDDQLADGLLPPAPTVNDNMKLLVPVRPLLENADLTIVNFESTLSDQAYFSQNGPRPAAFHPTAWQVYASPLVSAMALKQAGVDIVDLGNNHVYDMLEAGLHKTLSTFNHAGVLYFGAGLDETDAWKPLIISSKGQSIAFIGCTTLRNPLGTPMTHDVRYVAFDVLHKGGAAYCAEAALRSAVLKAKQQADVVIVMIHGGSEYDRTPTKKITYLSQVAKQAGATLIINHHPHVVSGFRQTDQSLIAWSLGNLFYDQTVWPSLESYMLAVYVREGKVIRAYIEPLIIDGFIPHGVTGELADYVARGAAGREAGPFIMENGSMEVDFGEQALQHTYTATIDGGSKPGQILPIPQAQWISQFNGSGKLLLGRDLLWVGGFENEEVESPTQGPPLWDLNLGSIHFGREYAYAGDSGIRLARDGQDNTDALTSSVSRVTVAPYDQLSITGMLRMNYGAAVFVQLSWYSATSGPSFSKTLKQIEVQPDNTWHPFRLDVEVPRSTKALGLYLRLALPGREEGKTIADFDNIRIIQWAAPGAPFSPLYNFALLTGAGDITFMQEYLPGAEAWNSVSPFEENK
jgi:poly-gamma-glutamate capsule biosynthesis protein CapA/YwtB (metallophosphatase superfamily)